MPRAPWSDSAKSTLNATVPKAPWSDSAKGTSALENWSDSTVLRAPPQHQRGISILANRFSVTRLKTSLHQGTSVTPQYQKHLFTWGTCQFRQCPRHLTSDQSLEEPSEAEWKKECKESAQTMENRIILSPNTGQLIYTQKRPSPNWLYSTCRDHSHNTLLHIQGWVLAPRKFCSCRDIQASHLHSPPSLTHHSMPGRIAKWLSILTKPYPHSPTRASEIWEPV